MDSDATVRSVITGEYVGVSESDTVLEVVKLMREEHASAVVVLRGNEPVGILTEFDVMGVVAEEADPAATTAEDVMSSPVESVSADASLVDAANAMSSEGIRNLLVEDPPTGDVLGLLTDRDVIAAVGSQLPTNGPGDVGAPVGTATSPGSVGAEAVEAQEVGGAEAESDAYATQDDAYATQDDAYSTQGVCEACGTLTDSLAEVNGQLVCPDCREM